MAVFDVVDAQGRVVNRIVLDDSTDWTPPDGCKIRPSDGSLFGEPPPSIEIPPTIPNTISDRQFFHALALQELITQEEALAAVKTGDIPAVLMTFVGTLTTEDKFAAEMLLSGAVEFRRDHPLTAALGAGLDWTSDQLDELWRTAAQL